MSSALLMVAMMLAGTGSLSEGLSLAQPERGTNRRNLELELRGLRPAWLPDRGLSPSTVGLLAGARGEEGRAALEPQPEEARLIRLRHWERTLKWSTAGALVVTSSLGTMAALNQPTAFGDGRCQTGNPVLGTYGCDRGLSTLHGASGVLSATLYTANGVLALSIPGPAGNVSEGARAWHRALTYVHLGGMVLQPLIGLVSAFPQVIGMRDAAPGDRFPRNARTIHVGLGYLTTAAYLATLALER